MCGHELTCQREEGRRHVRPRRAGEERALDLPAHPSATAELLHSNRRMEKGTFSTLPPSPGAARRDGGTGFAYGAAGKASKRPHGGLGMLQGMAATRHSPLQVDNSVPVGLSQSHGCWVAVILSSWSSKGCGRSPGGLGSWSGLLQEEDGSAWGQFCSVGLRSNSGISVCGTRDEIQRDQRNPEPNVVLGRSRGQATGCHSRIMTPVDEGGPGRDGV